MFRNLNYTGSSWNFVNLTDWLLELVAITSLFLLLLMGFLVILLLVIKIGFLAWERDVARCQRWMRPILEECLSDPGKSRKSFGFLSPFQRKVLQYVLIFRSFGQSGDILERLGQIYDELHFVDADLGRMVAWAWWTRAEGARCLGQMKCRRAKPALLRRLYDPVTEVRLVAAWSLGRIGDTDTIAPSLEALVSASRLAGLRLSSTVFELGEKAVPALMDVLGHEDPAVRLLAIHLLGEMRARSALGKLIEKTADGEDKEVRVAAYKALGTLAFPEVSERLVAGLRDSAWEVRAQAARGLGCVGKAENVEALCVALNDPKWWVRRNAGEALTRLGRAGFEALAEIRRKGSSSASEMAAQWLDEVESVPSDN